MSLRLVTENWPPVTYEKAGEAQGMAVELAQLIQQRVNSRERIEVLPWPRAYQLALSQPNVVLFTVVKTPERENLLNLLGPVATGQIAIFTRADFHSENLDSPNLKNTLRNGVHRGTAFHSTLEASGFKQIVPLNSPVAGVKMLMKGRLDAYCDDELAIAELFRRAGHPKTPFKKVVALKNSDFYFAFSPGTAPASMLAWNDALVEIKRSGEFNRLYQKWFGDLKAPESVVLHRRSQK